MSLDIYLASDELIEEECVCACCANVHKTQIKKQYFQANITHNLAPMAKAVGIYDCLWRAHENGYTHAEQLIEPLKKAYKELEENPIEYSKLNPPNGWGSYAGLCSFVYDLLEECKEHPNAIITVSR